MGISNNWKLKAGEKVATDCQYWVKKPAKEQYLFVCNEFLLCTNNVAKGLKRF